MLANQWILINTLAQNNYFFIVYPNLEMDKSPNTDHKSQAALIIATGNISQ